MRPRPGGFSRSAKRSIWLAEVRGPSRRATWASVFSSGPVRTSTRTRPDARAAVPKRRAGARRRGPAAAARAVWRRARRAHRRADPRAPRTRAGLPTRSVARPAVALPAHGGMLDRRLPQRRLPDSRLADDRDGARSLGAEEGLDDPQLRLAPDQARHDQRVCASLVLGEDGRGRRRCPPLVELQQREAHHLVARNVGALADELPRLAERPLGRQSADRVIHVSEQSIRIHLRAPIRLQSPDSQNTILNTRHR
jgi:hypothetical protein